MHRTIVVLGRISAGKCSSAIASRAVHDLWEFPLHRLVLGHFTECDKIIVLEEWYIMHKKYILIRFTHNRTGTIPLRIHWRVHSNWPRLLLKPLKPVQCFLMTRHLVQPIPHQRLFRHTDFSSVGFFWFAYAYLPFLHKISMEVKPSTPGKAQNLKFNLLNDLFKNNSLK